MVLLEKNLALEKEFLSDLKHQLEVQREQLKSQTEKLLIQENEMNEQKLKLLIKFDQIKVLEDFYNQYTEPAQQIHLDIEVSEHHL